MAIYGISVHPQNRWANQNTNQFLIDGMSAQEWANAVQGRTMAQFWQTERQILQGHADAIFNQAVQMAEGSLQSFPLDGLLTTSATIATKDIQQVLGAYSSWQHFSDIFEQGSSAGRVFGFDIETFGDIQKARGVFGITELALGERVYSGGGLAGKMSSNNLSLAIGITPEQATYLRSIGNKFKRSGWDSLDETEQVAFLRTSRYGGRPEKVFKEVSGADTVFKNSKKYLAINELGNPTLSLDTYMQGINNLSWAYSRADKSITTHAEDVIGDFVSFVKATQAGNSDTVHNLFYGANSKFDITGVTNIMNQYASLRGDIGVIQGMGDEMLDIIYLARAAAANLHESIGAYNESISGHYIGASVDELLRAATIGGEQTHFGAFDNANEGGLLDFHKVNTFDKYFSNSEALSRHLESHSVEDSVLFIRRGQLDKTTGAEFAYIPFTDDSIPARIDAGYSITNEYWSFDTEHSGVMTIAGKNGEQSSKYVLALRNYADELNGLKDKATRIVLTADSQEELMERASRIIDGGASEIFDKQNLTTEEVIQQQRFKYVDEGRREFAKYFSANSVRSEYSSAIHQEILTGGYDTLRIHYELHQKLGEWESSHSSIKTVEDLQLALRDLYGDSGKFDRFGDPKTPLTSRYQMQAFLETRHQFDNERELIEDIITSVNDVDTRMSASKRTFTNIDRTILAGQMYDEATETLLSGRTLMGGTEALSYHSDLYGLDLVDMEGGIHRVDAYTTGGMASRLSSLFGRSSVDDISAMLSNLHERELLSTSAYVDMYNHVQNGGSAYHIATDLAYQLEPTRGRDKQWALQLTQDNLLSAQRKTYINAGGQTETFAQAYQVMRGQIKTQFDSITSNYSYIQYVNSHSLNGLQDVATSILTGTNMYEGDVVSKTKLITDMFEARDYDTHKYSRYAINGRQDIQTFVVTPEGKGSAYMFFTTQDKVGNLMEALNSDKFKGALGSATELRDSGIFEYGTFIEIPKLNVYDIGDANHKLYSVNQGPASEKFLMPSINTPIGADNKLRGYFNDPEYEMLALYRKVGGSFLDAVEESDNEGAYRIFRRAFNAYLEDKPSSSTYRFRDSKRTIHFGVNDAIHAYEIRMQDALDTIFKKMVLPGEISVSGINGAIYDNNLNSAQMLVKHFGQVLGMDINSYEFGHNNAKYFDAVMKTNEWQEFFRRRMVFGSPAEEKWFTGVYRNPQFDKPIYQLIKDFAASEEGAKIFDKSLIDVIAELPPVEQLTPLGSESAVENGSYFTMRHGVHTAFAGNYSTMRPVYTQQYNAVSFDADLLRGELQGLDFQIANSRGYSNISVGTQSLENATYKMITALQDVEGVFVGEREFMARVKSTDIDALQSAYANARSNSDSIIRSFTDKIKDTAIADVISKTGAGSQTAISYEEVFRRTMQYMSQEMNSTYQDKIWYSPALQDTFLFNQRDPIKLKFNLENIDVHETRNILNNLLGENDSVELDSDTIIGRRRNGRAIYYNKAKAVLTRENIDELLSEETNGVTRLATRVGDIADNKVMISGMEKGTVHTINIDVLARQLFGDAPTATQRQFTSAFASHLFDTIHDGAMFVGSFSFSKHGGLVGHQSIWNTITKNFLEKGEGEGLVTILNQLRGNYQGLEEFSIVSDKIGQRIVGSTALASNTSQFIEEVYARIQAEAATESSPWREIANNIVNEMEDLKATSSANLTVGRMNMTETLGVRLAIDQRIDQAIRERGLRTARNATPGQSVGIQEIDMIYADNLRKFAESYDATGSGLRRHGLRDLQRAMDDLSIARNYDRIQRNVIQKNMRRSLSGVMEAIDYYDSQFEGDTLRRGAEYIHNRGIIEVDIEDLIASTRKKGNVHLLRSGGSIEEAEQGLFYINGRPSQYLQKLADQKGFILDDQTHSLWIDMSAYKPTIIQNGRQAGERAVATIDGFLLPIQNISDMASEDGKLFFQNQQGKVAHFIDQVAEAIYKQETDEAGKLSAKLGALYSDLIQDLNLQTKRLDKNSDLYKAMQQYVMPNSHEFFALDEAAPLLADKNGIGKELSQLNAERKDILARMAEPNGAYDKNLIEQYTSVNARFNQRLRDLADLAISDDKTYHELMTLGSNSVVRNAADIVVDGKQYHGLAVLASEEAIERLGYNFGSVAMDVIADYEHRAAKAVSIERLEDFVKLFGGDEAFETRIRGLHSSLQEEFAQEIADYKFIWDSNANVTDELNRFMSTIRKENSSPDLNINIRTLNENIAHRASGVFKQSGIGQSYFSNIGTYSEFLRYPSFKGQPIVRLLLDSSMGEGVMARITNPILSAWTKVDFDGDKIFLASVTNGSSVLHTDTQLFQGMEAIYRRLVTEEAPGLLRESILSMSGYKADNPNDVVFQQAKLLEIADSDAYKKAISQYLEDMHYDPNLDLSLEQNAGILEAALRSDRMAEAYRVHLPNTLLNTNMEVASFVARFRKNNIGYISTPNYKIREALMQAEQFFTKTGDTAKLSLVSDTLYGLSNMFSEAGGLFDMAEQKSIDVKHARDGLELTHITRYSRAMNNLMKMDYATVAQKSLQSAEDTIFKSVYTTLQAIGPKIFGITSKEDVNWLAGVLSEYHQGELTSDYLKGIIAQYQQGKTVTLAVGNSTRVVDKQIAEWIIKGMPIAQLTDVARTAPKVTEIFKNTILSDDYRAMRPILNDILGKNVSEEEYKRIAREVLGNEHGSAFGDDIIEMMIDHNSPEITRFTEGNVYYVPHDSVNTAYSGKTYVYEGMQNGKYSFAQLQKDGRYRLDKKGNRVRETFDVTPGMFVSPDGGMNIQDFQNNAAMRQQLNLEAKQKFTANILNRFTIGEDGRVLTTRPDLKDTMPKPDLTAKAQPWSWKFANNLFGGDDTAAVIANYEAVNQYAKAYELGIAHKVFDNNAPDSAAGMIRQVNEAIAKRKRTNYKDHAGSWAAEVYDDFARSFGGASVFDEYLQTAQALPDQFSPVNFAKRIEDFSQNLYNISDEISEAEQSFAKLQSTIDILKSDASLEHEVQALQKRYDGRQTFIQQHQDFLQNANKTRITTLQNSIYGANGIAKTEVHMDAIFNWRTAKRNNMLVGFGSYFGKSFSQLNAQDLSNIRLEADALLKATNGVPLTQLERYAIDTTVKNLAAYTPTASVSALKTPLRSSNLSNTLAANDTLIQYVMSKQSNAQKAANEATQTAAQAAKNAKKKTLSGSFLDSIKDMGITGKHVGIAVGALAALGITNKLLHKDRTKSPLAQSESGLDGVPEGKGQSGGYQNGAPPSSRTVYHQDSRSGLTFKVNASTKRRIDAMNSGGMVRQAGGGNANIYTYNDTTGVSDNWLANKFAELAQ